MRKTLMAIVLTLALVLLASAAAARNIYVNNVAGNDKSSGSRPGIDTVATGPVQTIARALRLAQSGDRIVLAATGQPYRESISLMGSRHSGTPGEPLVMEGHGAILDGAAPVPPGAWEHYLAGVYRFRPPHVEFQQLFLGARPLARVPDGMPAAEPPKLDPLQWCLHGAYVYFAVEPGKFPEDYPLSFADQQVGITLYDVQWVVIQDLTVRGFQLDGTSAFNSARAVRLVGVTCRANGRSGVAVGGASIVELDSCVLGGNGQAQLLTLPWSETVVKRSQLLSDTAPARIDRGGKLEIDGKRVPPAR
jgi:hypothetical protein